MKQLFLVLITCFIVILFVSLNSNSAYGQVWQNIIWADGQNRILDTDTTADTIIVKNGGRVEIKEGVTLHLKTFTVYGGTLDNYGTIVVQGGKTADNDHIRSGVNFAGILNNFGTIELEPSSALDVIDSVMTNNGKVLVKASDNDYSYFDVYGGKLVNTGEIVVEAVPKKAKWSTFRVQSHLTDKTKTGFFENNGMIQSDGHISLGGQIENHGTVQSNDDISLWGKISNHGKLVSHKKFYISEDTIVDNFGTLLITGWYQNSNGGKLYNHCGSSFAYDPSSQYKQNPEYFLGHVEDLCDSSLSDEVENYDVLVTIPKNFYEDHFHNCPDCPLEQLTIKKGQTIVWQNQDNYVYRIILTIVNDASLGPEVYDIGNVFPKKTFSYTFDKAGQYWYRIDIGEGITGHYPYPSWVEYAVPITVESQKESSQKPNLDKKTDVVPKDIQIPSWIKDIAGYWCDEKISDGDFIEAIRFLVKEKYIKIQSTSDGGSIQKIPNWVKNNACWWTDGLLSDADFANAIQFLIKNKMIRV